MSKTQNAMSIIIATSRRCFTHLKPTTTTKHLTTTKQRRHPQQTPLSSYQIIDLSVPLTNKYVAGSDPPGYGPQITYVNHQQSVPALQEFFKGLKKQDLPRQEGWAVETVTLSTHSGTHVDAPYHYSSHTPSGAQSKTIDQVPLSWLALRPAVVLDFSNKPRGTLLGKNDLIEGLRIIQHELYPLDVVLIKTGARFGDADYWTQGCGVGREGTLWLMDQGIRVTGTDAWSWDAPFPNTLQRFSRDHDASVIWEGHFAGGEREESYLHIEKLYQLDRLPSKNFLVSLLPVKIDAASAGWCRAVAFVPSRGGDEENKVDG